jgi:hypothetical protein
LALKKIFHTLEFQWRRSKNNSWNVAEHHNIWPQRTSYFWAICEFRNGRHCAVHMDETYSTICLQRR